MRNLPALLEAELEGKTYGICRIIEIRKKNGSYVRLAEHQANITVDAKTYVRARGFRVSSMPFVLNASSSGVEFEVVAADDGSIDPDALRNGIFDSASVIISAVSHILPANGKIDLFRGQFGDVSFSDRGLAKITVDGLMSKAKELIIEHYTPTCRAFLGDARCRVDIESLQRTATISSVSGYNVHIGGAATGLSSDYWNLGLIIPTAGPSVGDAFEIRDWDASTNIVKTYLPLAGKLIAGDEVKLSPGCDFTRGSLGCNRYNNIQNYRGEPYVPGTDAEDITYSEWGV